MANTQEPGGGGGTRTRRRRPPRRIPTAPPPRGGSGGVPPGGGYTPPSGGGTGSGSSGGGSSMGGGGGGYSSYAADQAEADRKAQQKWLEQAKTIQEQIDSLKIALGSDGLRRALGIQLRGIFREQEQVLDVQRADYHSRVQSLRDVQRDNAEAQADQSFGNLANRGRERANAMSEATLQGAGESDMLAAQGASLRNWNANQTDINRAYYDTLTSVNSSLTDLTIDTRTGMIGTIRDANADRAGLWADYYGNRGEVLTMLGNTLGQQAEYYGLAQEAKAGDGLTAKQDAATKASGFYFDRAAAMTGMAWKNPGIKASLRNWKGVEEIEGGVDSTYHGPTGSQAGADTGAKPEGSTLREWAK